MAQKYFILADGTTVYEGPADLAEKWYDHRRALGGGPRWLTEEEATEKLEDPFGVCISCCRDIWEKLRKETLQGPPPIADEDFLEMKERLADLMECQKHLEGEVVHLMKIMGQY